MDIKITVFDKQQYDAEWPSEDAIEFIAFFQEKLASIPEEFRSSAIIEVDSISGYEGSSYASINIYYYRPETEEEVKVRESKAQNKAELLRQRELKQLEELKRKYGA